MEQKLKLQLRLKQKRIGELTIAEAKMLDKLKGEELYVTPTEEDSPLLGILTEHGTNYIKLEKVIKFKSYCSLNDLAELAGSFKDGLGKVEEKRIVTYCDKYKQSVRKWDDIERYNSLLMNKRDISKIIALKDYKGLKNSIKEYFLNLSF